MDKVNNSNRQAMPLWERQPHNRGHRSAVDGALRAHRQRAMERQARVQERLDMVKQISTDFFPTLGVQRRVEMETFQNDPVQQNFYTNPSQYDQGQDVALMDVDQIQSFIPQSMDEIYSEAQLGSTSDNALAVVQKDLSNPEDGPVEDMPKGSYIDYTV